MVLDKGTVIDDGRSRSSPAWTLRSRRGRDRGSAGEQAVRAIAMEVLDSNLIAMIDRLQDARDRAAS